MSYVHALRESFEANAAEDPAYDRAMRELAGGILSGSSSVKIGGSSVRLGDIVCQTFRSPSPISVGVLVSAMMRFSQAAFIGVKVGVCPGSDRELKRNAKALDALPAPFSASLWCGNKEPDGSLTWTRPAAFEEDIGWKPWLAFLPLEVGYCEPETLYWHLVRGAGFARWPYGHDMIYAFMIEANEWADWWRLTIGL